MNERPEVVGQTGTVVHVEFGESQQVRVTEAGIPSDGTPLHYTICGLDDVYLLNGFKRVEDGDESYVVIEDMAALWKAIGLFLVERRKVLKSREIRFLRHRMDMTQAELAAYLRVDDQTVARWEKGRAKLPGPADVAIRTLFLMSPSVQPEGQAALTRFKELIDELVVSEEPESEINFMHREHEWQEAV